MKAYIELKNGFWTVNDKRANRWNPEEQELINEFLKIVKYEEPKQPPTFLEKLKNFFRKSEKKSYQLIKKNKFLLIKQIH